MSLLRFHSSCSGKAWQRDEHSNPSTIKDLKLQAAASQVVLFSIHPTGRSELSVDRAGKEAAHGV